MSEDRGKLPGHQRWMRTAPAGLPVLVFCVATLCFIHGHPMVLAGFPLDDAWIHRVYSRSFSEGAGFAYNPGVQEAGSTSPLWAIVSAPAHWLSFGGTTAVVFSVKGISFLLGCLTIAGVYVLGYMLGGARLPALLAASLFAVEPAVHFALLSGMENTLLFTLLVWCGICLTANKPGRATLLAGLAVVARPEAVLWLLLAGGLTYRLYRPEKRSACGLYAALLMAPLGAWLLFCHTTTGHLLPNTFYLKSSFSGFSWSALGTGLHIMQAEYGWAQSPVFWIGWAAGTLWCGVQSHPHKRTTLTFFFGIAFLAFAPVILFSRNVHTHGYYWTRWLEPGLFGLVLVFCLGSGGLLTLLWTPLRAGPPPFGIRPKLLRLTGLVWLIALAVGWSDFSATFTRRAARFASDARIIHTMNVQPGMWIRRHTQPGAVIGVNDAGALRYFGERTTIDLLGLNNKEIAFGQASKASVRAALDWLAVYPSWFRGWGFEEEFTPTTKFHVPLERYTICQCPSQTTMYIYRRTVIRGRATP